MKTPPRIVVTRKIPENGIMLLKRHFVVDINDQERDLSQRELQRELHNAFGVVAVMANRFGREFIEKLDSLRVISNFAVGYDNVDVSAATEKGIVVTNTPGVLTDATADLALGLLLSVSRRIVEGDRLVRARKFSGWTPMMMLGNEVSGKTIGIIGAGRIGTAIARRALGFGMTIFYFSHRRNDEIEKLGGRYVGLQDLLKRSDFVSVNVSLNRETKGLVGKREIGMMKSSAILINTARGEIVDEVALIAALKEGRIGGAGLDVYKNEPKVNRGLIKLDNVVLAPHLGSATMETRAKMAELAAMNAIAVLQGEKPPAVINPEVLEANPR
jgi:glyoxylate reductase